MVKIDVHGQSFNRLTLLRNHLSVEKGMIASYTDVMLKIFHQLEMVEALEEEVKKINDEKLGLVEQIDFLNKEVRDILRLSVSRPMMMGQSQSYQPTFAGLAKTEYSIDMKTVKKQLTGVAGEIEEYISPEGVLLPSNVKEQVTIKMEKEEAEKKAAEAALPPPPPSWGEKKDERE